MKSLAFLSILLLNLACGKQEEPKAPSPPPGPGAPQGAAMGANLEDVVPGTPLRKHSNISEALTALAKSIDGQGTATLQSQSEAMYVIEYTAQGSILKKMGNPANVPIQNPNFEIMGKSYGSGEQATLSLYSHRTGEQQVFYFEYRILLNGLILESTDQVAYFSAGNSGNDIVRFGYRGQNPTLQRFVISSAAYDYFDTYTYGLPQLHVDSLTYTTTFQYRSTR